MHIVLVLCALLAAIPVVGRAQSYPRWFLEQEALRCPTTIGFTDPAPIRDSSVSYARQDALLNAQLFAGTLVVGGDAYWNTEAGATWLGSDVEEYPVAGVAASTSAWAVKSEWHGSTLSAVLMADSVCKISPAMNVLINVGTTKPPAWIDSPPQTPGYVTSVGMAVLYYHPISSWHEAEKIGRRNLAATVSSSVRQLEKHTATEGQAISHSEIRAQLSNVRVLRRWEDPKEGICYVLMRMPMP